MRTRELNLSSLLFMSLEQAPAALPSHEVLKQCSAESLCGSNQQDYLLLFSIKRTLVNVHYSTALIPFILPYWLLKVACETIYGNMQKHTKEYSVWLLKHTRAVWAAVTGSVPRVWLPWLP